MEAGSESRLGFVKKVAGYAKGALKIVTFNKASAVASALLASLIVTALVAPWIVPYDPLEMQYTAEGRLRFLEPPSKEHWFGTTDLGRDIFSQTLVGLRLTLLVGLLGGFGAAIIGVNIAILAGYYRGKVDMILSRVVDFTYTLPLLPLALVAAGLFGANIWVIIATIVLISWRFPARAVRSEVLSIAKRPFIKAARSIGASDLRIIYLHLAPNVLSLAVVYASLVAGWSILTEASVSFLGLGDPRLMSLGRILQRCHLTGAITYAWWWAIPPGLFIMLIVVSLYFISHSLEELINPKLRAVGQI